MQKATVVVDTEWILSSSHHQSQVERVVNLLVLSKNDLEQKVKCYLWGSDCMPNRITA